MDLAKAERFIALFNDGCSVSKMAKELGQSSTSTSRQFVLLKVHGAQVFIDHYVHGIRPTFNELEKACIVEFVLENHLGIEQAASVFRMNHNSLCKLVAKRKAFGAPLYPEAVSSKVSVPANIGNANCQALVKDDHQTSKSTSELTFLQKTGREKNEAYDIAQLENGANLVYSSENAKPKPKIDAKPLDTPVGRATAPVKVWRPNHRKDIAAAKKDQERKEARKKASEFNSAEDSGKPSKLSKSSHWEDPNPPHPAQEYFDKNGDVPGQVFFDPMSDRFDELPTHIQLRSLKRYCNDQKETIICLKKLAEGLFKPTLQ